VAQEGSPSPVAGRNYELLASRGRDLNNHGDTCFKANLDGGTLDDEMLVHDGAVFVRERDLLSGTFFPFESFGTGPLRCDDNGNLLWFGDWNDPNTDVDSGLFLGHVMLVQEGVTMIGGQIVDTIASGGDAFALSDNGRWVVFEALLLNGTEGAFMLEITPPPTVPDGDVVPGDQLLAGKNGANIDVTWDATTCTADEYHLLYGDFANVATLDYAGASCNLGTTGATTFAPPPGSIFWVVAAADVSNVEGAHGFDGEGAPRNASAGGLCGLTAQVKGASCP